MTDRYDPELRAIYDRALADAIATKVAAERERGDDEEADYRPNTGSLTPY